MIREVVVAGHPGVLGMELTGACDIIGLANAVAAEAGRPPPYRLTVASMGGGPLELWGGLQLAGTADLAGLRRPIDTLLVVGGPCAHQAAEDGNFVGVVRRLAARSRRIGALCTGAFILAEAGVLDGRRATTHWMYGELLAQRHPGVDVDTDPVFMSSADGVWTTAGVTASYDLLLSFVEEDLGADVARDIARVLVVFLRRTGNQAQFSAQLRTQVADRSPLRELQQYIADHPDADLSLAALARRAHMSPRHLGRVFCQQVGMSPGRYVERIRLETARRRLEESDQSVEAVAQAAGFGSTETMRRVFVTNLAVSPTDYRRRFGRSQEESPQ
ncbi:MAG TPA: helix-turn-helix domain-containing protein [Acidimicrobiia bacterium]|nr:helix-turn-helix domain-containing protein [Acidimicrobiia bacterium]